MSKVYSMVAGGFIGWGTSTGLFFGDYLAMTVYYFVAVGILYLSYVEYCNRQALKEFDTHMKRLDTEMKDDLNQLMQSLLELNKKQIEVFQQLRIQPQLQLPDLREKPVEHNACFRYPEQDPSCRLN